MGWSIVYFQRSQGILSSKNCYFLSHADEMPLSSFHLSLHCLPSSVLPRPWSRENIAEISAKSLYLWRFLPQELIWINPKAGCAPVFCYDTLFILKSGSLRGPTANTKWQQTACQYITPWLCVRARVNIAQPQSPGANAPVLKNYVKYLLMFKEV